MDVKKRHHEKCSVLGCELVCCRNVFHSPTQIFMAQRYLDEISLEVIRNSIKTLTAFGRPVVPLV